ncbi:MAG: hypothetical protein LUD17_12325 [Bacteroidales bacterium]|nr:hypothetical protein [Bacteroidales bacterium]
MSEIPQELNLEEYREEQFHILYNDPHNIEAICELVCASALLCEKNAQMYGPFWENPELCRTIAHYMPEILEYPEKLPMAENVLSKAIESLYDHPRLKLRLLMLKRDAIEAKGDQLSNEAGMGLDELSQEIMQLQHNIMAADRGDFDAIIDNRAHLKHDPVEWTREWEDVIAIAQRDAAERMADTPKGMGYCFAWWSSVQDMLLRQFQLNWRTPAEHTQMLL